MRRLTALLLAVAPHVSHGQAASAPTTVKVTVDTLHSEVVILAGPFDLAMPSAAMPGMGHGMMHHSSRSPMMRFPWPVDGSLHGVDIVMTDAAGGPAPKQLLHHLDMLDFDRGQLIHESVERLFAWGQDTQTILLPDGVAVPIARGEHLGFWIAWHNDTGRDIRGAYVRIALKVVPPRSVKTKVMPFYADVHNVNGGDNDYDLPAGKSMESHDFTLPMNGRLIMVGGHMHRYGRSVSMVDLKSGKVLVKLSAIRDSTGDVTSVRRFVFGFNDDALQLQAGHPYRVVAEYDNTSGQAITNGGMGHLVGVFEPSDLAKWPRVDPTDPETMKDIKSFPPDLGAPPDEHAGMAMP